MKTGCKTIFISALLLLVLGGCGADTSKMSPRDGKLATQTGVVDAESINLKPGQAGYLVYGPYINLEAGTYRLVAKGMLNGGTGTIGTIDVVSDKGKYVWAIRPIYSQGPAIGDARNSAITSVAFYLDKPVVDAEFRILITDSTAKGVFTGYELTKISSN